MYLYQLCLHYISFSSSSFQTPTAQNVMGAQRAYVSKFLEVSVIIFITSNTASLIISVEVRCNGGS